MSTSRHPIALKLEGVVGGDAKLLATVMALPLLDGIFPALVLAGALSETIGPYPVVGTLPLGVVQVGLLVFGGSATVAVVLAEMEGTRGQRVRTILAVGAVLTVGAALEAAIAPTLESVLRLEIFERFAALVIVAIAAKTASARIGEYLPRPGVIVGAGLIASIDLQNPELAFSTEPGLVVLAAGSAIVATVFALSIALTAPQLRARMDIDRFRFGSAVALGLLALSILQLNVGSAPLLVLFVAAIFAYDPDGVDDQLDPSAETATDTPLDSAPDRTPDTVTPAPATDGGTSPATASAMDGTDDDAVDSDSDDATDDDRESDTIDDKNTVDDDGDDTDASASRTDSSSGSDLGVDREPWL